MSRRTIVTMVLACSVCAGCSAHLGKNYGDANRAAFSAQTQRDALPPAGMDETDAAAVRTRRTPAETADTEAPPSDPYAMPR